MNPTINSGDYLIYKDGLLIEVIGSEQEFKRRKKEFFKLDYCVYRVLSKPERKQYEQLSFYFFNRITTAKQPNYQI